MTGEQRACRFLAWDSEFFGLRIATLELSEGATVDAQSLERALAWCRSEAIDCLYLLAAASEPATLALAEEHGFRLVDVRMTFELALAAAPADAREHASLRPARASDLAALRALAAVSHTRTRFWSDPRFARAACAELYATWIEKSVRGGAECVWVAEHEGQVAGYLSCHLRRDPREPGARGEIGLFAVASGARGRGLGRALIEHATRWFHAQGCARVTVVTQGASVAAQRLYQVAGFRTSAVQLWHHRWFARDAHVTPR